MSKQMNLSHGDNSMGKTDDIIEDALLSFVYGYMTAHRKTDFLAVTSRDIQRGVENVIDVDLATICQFMQQQGFDMAYHKGKGIVWVLFNPSRIE